ncbi:helix-turn-helix domain-containing protein [Paraburkholderia sp. MM5384-R2]
MVAHGSHGLTVAELVILSGLDRPTVRRIVQALEDRACSIRLRIKTYGE